MILYVNSKGEVKDVDVTEDSALTELPISENSVNPFTNWSVARICCYRVGVIPEKVTEVVGTEDCTYTDLEGNEVIKSVDITETRETGKYIISMMTPYVDSRLMEHIAKLGNKDEAIEVDVTNTQIGLFENYSQTMDISDELTNTQLGLLESYNMTTTTAEEVTQCQLALLELYNIITGGK